MELLEKRPGSHVFVCIVQSTAARVFSFDTVNTRQCKTIQEVHHSPTSHIKQKLAMRRNARLNEFTPTEHTTRHPYHQA